MPATPLVDRLNKNKEKPSTQRRMKTRINKTTCKNSIASLSLTVPRTSALQTCRLIEMLYFKKAIYSLIIVRICSGGAVKKISLNHSKNPVLPVLQAEVCIRCLLVFDSSQTSVILHWWRWFQSLRRSHYFSDWVQGHQQQ